MFQSFKAFVIFLILLSLVHSNSKKADVDEYDDEEFDLPKTQDKHPQKEEVVVESPSPSSTPQTQQTYDEEEFTGFETQNPTEPKEEQKQIEIPQVYIRDNYYLEISFCRVHGCVSCKLLDRKIRE